MVVIGLGVFLMIGLVVFLGVLAALKVHQGPKNRVPGGIVIGTFVLVIVIVTWNTDALGFVMVGALIVAFGIAAGRVVSAISSRPPSAGRVDLDRLERDMHP